MFPEIALLLALSATSSHYPVGIGPHALVAADLNRDGHIDLVTANENGGSVSVLMNNGDGTFQPHRDYSACWVPYGLVAADLNGDGYPDLVVTCSGDAAFAVLLNQRDGTFGNSTVYFVGPDSLSLVVMDVNGDGIPDVVTASLSEGDIYVEYGNGDGTFRTGPAWPTPYRIAGLVQYDATHLAIADYGGNIALVDTVGNLGRPYPVGQQTQALAVYGTGLIAAGEGMLGGYVAWLQPGPGGQFSQRQTLQVGGSPQSLTVGDLNGDGIPDLIVTNGSAQSITVFYGTPMGFSSGVTIQAGVLPDAAVIADLNGDGVPDLAVANYTDIPSDVWVWLSGVRKK